HCIHLSENGPAMHPETHPPKDLTGSDLPSNKRCVNIIQTGNWIKSLINLGPVAGVSDGTDQATIDPDFGASDVGRTFARQECDDVGELLRLAVAPSRDGGDRCLAYSLYVGFL